jgi:uncharacterized protein YnzC (UPF0291/DUF896 family)
MMKRLKQYITESIRTYDYTIKIAGDVDKKFLDLFKYNLNKFDPIEISDPISTPIQKSPYGFPDLANQSVSIIKARFRYPATEPMIQQVAQLLGHNINTVRVISSNYDDSINAEADQYANQAKESPLLDKEDMGSTDDAKKANKEYGRSYLDNIKDQMKGNTINIPYAAKKTPASFDPFKAIPQDKKGGKSPMSKMIRPAKPKTGSKIAV